MDKIVCNECGWSWKLSDGGNDPYVCHSCYTDNSKKYEKMEENKTMSEKDRLISFGIGLVLITTSLFLLVKSYTILKSKD
jgi:hypothetical protein